MSSSKFVWALVTATTIAGYAPLALGQPNAAQDQEYRLGRDDVLQLNVLERPELDGEMTVQPDSTVFIPLVGEVAVGGLTVVEAERLIQQRLRLYDPDIDSVTLTVTQYNALQIYVLGAVANPGSHTFTAPPTLWDVLRNVGGPSEGANLTMVRLITEEDGEPVTRTINLGGWLSGGELPDVALRSGDTLIIPGGAEGAVAGFDPEAGVQIIGAVAAPSTVPITEPTRLLTCLMMAGSPSPAANLEKVWWVHRDANEEFSGRRVDMKLYFERGSLAGNPLIYPGDSVRVEERSPGWFAANWGIILATLTTFTTFYLLFNRDRI